MINQASSNDRLEKTVPIFSLRITEKNWTKYNIDAS